MRPTKYFNVTLVKSQTNTYLANATGMPKGARLMNASCDNTTVGARLRIHVGTGTNTTILDVGQGSAGGNAFEEISSNGVPVDDLYYTSGSVDPINVTVASENY